MFLECIRRNWQVDRAAGFASPVRTTGTATRSSSSSDDKLQCKFIMLMHTICDMYMWILWLCIVLTYRRCAFEWTHSIHFALWAEEAENGYASRCQRKQEHWAAAAAITQIATKWRHHRDEAMLTKLQLLIMKDVILSLFLSRYTHLSSSCAKSRRSQRLWHRRTSSKAAAAHYYDLNGGHRRVALHFPFDELKYTWCIQLYISQHECIAK